MDILIFISFCITCYLCYKLGESCVITKIQDHLKKYLDDHDSMRELFEPGIEVAQHIIEQVKDKSIWRHKN